MSTAGHVPLVRDLQKLHTTYPACGCVSLSPASVWDYASVVGNGIQGALAFCRPVDEELVLSHEELFLPLFPFRGYLPVREHLPEIRQLVMDGQAEKAQALLHKLKVDGAIPLYNTTDPFVGACSLDMIMTDTSPATRYVRSVDFATGEALVAWAVEEHVFHRRFFVSRAHNLVVIRLSSPTGCRLNLSLGLREIAYTPHPHPQAQDIYGITIDQCESASSGSALTHRMHFKQRWETQPLLGSCTVGRVICQEGRLTEDGARIRITDGRDLTLLVQTIPERRGEAFSVEAALEKLYSLDQTYDQLLKAHTALHREIFDRCRLQLSSPEEQKIDTEALQASSTVGHTNPALVEKAFAAGRYGILSSTGHMPPLLQGVWTGTWKPRWSGDYTLNGNVQSMVAASLCTNHYECLEVLMDYLDSLMADFRENARELLGFRGPLIPWRASTHGRTHYLSCFNYYHDFPGIYWFAGAGWFSRLYYDYYLYSGDEVFFEKRLKPFLLDSAAFYEDYLTLEKDGVYVLSPSSSPENETAENVWMAPNATMTIAVIKQLLRTLLRLQTKLGARPGEVAKWQTMLDKLPAYGVGGNGALKEWSWPGLENREVHRHASHLYPLFFDVAPDIADSPALQAACRTAIDKRLEFRRQEEGSDMAFGFTQLGMAAAYLGETALAYECVEYLVNSYWSPAMVSLHNVRDVFNLDISGGLPAVIVTMLLQSFEPEEPGGSWSIHLLPCLPPAWPNGRLRGARCRGGFEVDLTWEAGALQRVTLVSLRGEPCRIFYKEKQTDLQPAPGASTCLSKDLTPQR